MKNMLREKLNKKGFTLAELLIVVAIIAVLVAVAIPVFGSAMTSAREGTDLANVRAAYAEAVIDAMGEPGYGKGGNVEIKIPMSTLEDAATYGTDVTHKGNVVTVGKAGSFEVDGDVVLTGGTGTPDPSTSP